MSGSEGTPDFRIIERVKAVLEDKRLEFSQRVVLARLMLSAGKSGEATWKHGTISERLGCSLATSKRVMKTLQKAGYVRVIQMGLKKANKYLMSWHPEFSGVSPMTPNDSIMGVAHETTGYHG
jgi:hypothetical protein